MQKWLFLEAFSVLSKWSRDRDQKAQARASDEKISYRRWQDILQAAAGPPSGSPPGSDTPSPTSSPSLYDLLRFWLYAEDIYDEGGPGSNQMLMMG
jgi:hypothetical protein